MYELFVTEAIVLGKRGVGESSTFVMLLTEKLGLVRALARSARAGKSKLRYGLEPLTRGQFTLVRGKNEWKLVGVEQVTAELMPHTVCTRQAAGRIVRLLLKLINGEEQTPSLYATVAGGLSALAHMPDRQYEEAVECVLVLRILSHLGYLPQLPGLEPFVASGQFTEELAAQAKRARTFLVRTINESLHATGL